MFGSLVDELRGAFSACVFFLCGFCFLFAGGLVVGWWADLLCFSFFFVFFVRFTFLFFVLFFRSSCVCLVCGCLLVLLLVGL